MSSAESNFSIPASIASLLDRGDFPGLTDDECAMLGAWLDVNRRKVVFLSDPAVTRRLNDAKRRLREIHGYNRMLRESASAKPQGDGEKQVPRDLIATAVAVEEYHVSRATIRRAVADERLRDYRRDGAAKNSSLMLSRAELEKCFPRR